MTSKGVQREGKLLGKQWAIKWVEMIYEQYDCCISGKGRYMNTGKRHISAVVITS